MSTRMSFHVRVMAYGWLAISLVSACSLGHPAQVSPSDIPDLEARLMSEPRNGELMLRYAAALFSAEQCDSAVVVAERGRELKLASIVGPLVIGQCLEQA